jgi:hypothetical protein
MISRPHGSASLDMFASLKPQSEGRSGFLQTVVDYADEFLKTHEALFNEWKSYQKEPSPGQLPNAMLNFDFRINLATLAMDDVLEFFTALNKSTSFDRGEVGCQSGSVG